jgi:hypothetical protein
MMNKSSRVETKATCDILPFNSRGDRLRRRQIFSYEVPVTIMNCFHLLEVSCEYSNLGNVVFPTCLARCNLFF